MKIGFTGHRDKICNEDDLRMINSAFPGATWIHGGAEGFDSQVSQFAQKEKIEELIMKPDYARHGPAAPLIRNRKVVDISDIIVVFYDKRKAGGTLYTLKYAQKKNKKIINLPSPINFIYRAGWVDLKMELMQRKGKAGI